MPAMTLNTPGAHVEVRPEVRPADVHIHPPASPPPTVVNEAAQITVPPSPSPVFMVPQAPAPVVMLPQAPPPIVEITNEINVPPPAPLKVERDARGQIKGIVPKE
jgi:hypothetical protein